MVAPAPLDGRPEVIVDVEVRDGLFSIVLRNIGLRPAIAVKTTFDKAFTGLGGRKAITTMRVFKGVPFMAPGKVFEQFVDPLAVYAVRREPMLLKATVRYRDRNGVKYEETMTHDLRLYMELGQAKRA